MISIVNATEEKKYIYKPFNLIVFKNYQAFLHTNHIINRIKDPTLRSTFSYIVALRGTPEQEMFNFLMKYMDLILESYRHMHYTKEEWYRITSAHAITNLKDYMFRHINYEGYEEFLLLLKNLMKNNYYLQYKICVLNKEDVERGKKDMLRLSMNEIIERYCIFRFLNQESRRVLFNCPLCKKKQITFILSQMKTNEKKMIFLKNTNRYIILEKLQDIPFNQTFSDRSTRYLYIKFGLSLFSTHMDIFKKAIYTMIHKVLCSVRLS